MTDSPWTDSSETSHPLDPAWISAYYDEALDEMERRGVEAHLARCPACRERLAAYAALGGGIRAGVDPPVPATLDTRAERLIRRYALARRARARASRRPARGAAWPLRSTIAAVLLLGLIGGALVLGLPVGQGVGGPTVASAYPCDDPSQCAIAVQFSGPVDHEAVERSFHIDPPAPVALSWQRDTLYVKPTRPLEPTESYTVSLQPIAGQQQQTASLPNLRPQPVVLSFVAGGASSPVAMARTSGISAGALARTSTQARAAGSVRPTRGASPPASVTGQPALAQASATTGAAMAVPSSTPCPVQPVRGFGALSRAQPGVAARLGCAVAPETSVDLFVEPFEHGLLLWRGDRREIYALLDNGHWSSYADTFNGTVTATPAPGEPVRGFGKVWHEHQQLRAAIGAARAPERPVSGAIQEFEHGTLVWTADAIVYALYADSTWGHYPDVYADQTATPTASLTPATTPTATPSVSPTPSTLPSPRPSASASASAPPAVTPAPGLAPGPPPCSIQPVRGFGLVYSSHPDVAQRLGCASGSEIGAGSTRETFEHGLLIRRDDVRQVFVIRGDGTWSVYPDTYQAGETLPDPGPVPAGRFVPLRGLAKVWLEQPGVRQALGWATAPEGSVNGAYEDFAAGHMVWTSDRVIYALFGDGTWQSFPDLFVDATPTPTQVSASPTPTSSATPTASPTAASPS